MAILNMTYWSSSDIKVPLDAISTIAVVWWDEEATITWTDPSDLVVKWVTVTTWTATKLVRKAGSAPVDSTDWTLVVTETVRDDYSVTWYTDTWLTNWTTYYYAAFAVWDNWLETISSTIPDVTPVASRLPSEYQEVEYIASTSGWWPYIDTWMANVTNKTKVEYSYIPYTNNEWIIFMDNGWSSNWFGNGWTYYYYWGYYSNTYTNVVWERVTFTIAKDGCYRNWTNMVTMSADIAPTWTVLLFANRRNWNIDWSTWRNCRLFYYKRWENWVLTQDLVPCYRKLDSVIGVYDVVNDVFYTNAWTWTFTKWSDVN